MGSIPVPYVVILNPDSESETPSNGSDPPPHVLDIMNGLLDTTPGTLNGSSTPGTRLAMKRNTMPVTTTTPEQQAISSSISGCRMSQPTTIAESSVSLRTPHMEHRLPAKARVIQEKGESR